MLNFMRNRKFSVCCRNDDYNREPRGSQALAIKLLVTARLMCVTDLRGSRICKGKKVIFIMLSKMIYRESEKREEYT